MSRHLPHHAADAAAEAGPPRVAEALAAALADGAEDDEPGQHLGGATDSGLLHPLEGDVAQQRRMVRRRGPFEEEPVEILVDLVVAGAARLMAQPAGAEQADAEAGGQVL